MGANKNLFDYWNDFQNSKLPKIETDVEVKPSTSLITTIFVAIAAIWLLFGRKK